VSGVVGHAGKPSSGQEGFGGAEEPSSGPTCAEESPAASRGKVYTGEPSSGRGGAGEDVVLRAIISHFIFYCLEVSFSSIFLILLKFLFCVIESFDQCFVLSLSCAVNFGTHRPIELRQRDTRELLHRLKNGDLIWKRDY